MQVKPKRRAKAAQDRKFEALLRRAALIEQLKKDAGLPAKKMAVKSRRKR
jgi:hypothetical protein